MEGDYVYTRYAFEFYKSSSNSSDNLLVFICNHLTHYCKAWKVFRIEDRRGYMRLLHQDNTHNHAPSEYYKECIHAGMLDELDGDGGITSDGIWFFR